MKTLALSVANGTAVASRTRSRGRRVQYEPQSGDSCWSRSRPVQQEFAAEAVKAEATPAGAAVVAERAVAAAESHAARAVASRQVPMLRVVGTFKKRRSRKQKGRQTQVCGAPKQGAKTNMREEKTTNGGRAAGKATLTLKPLPSARTTPVATPLEVKNGKTGADKATLTPRLLLSARPKLMNPPPRANVWCAWPRRPRMSSLHAGIKRCVRLAPRVFLLENAAPPAAKASRASTRYMCLRHASNRQRHQLQSLRDLSSAVLRFARWLRWASRRMPADWPSRMPTARSTRPWR